MKRNLEPKIPMCISVQLESGSGKDSRRVWLPLPATEKQFKAAIKKLNTHYFGVAINHYAVKALMISRKMLAETPLGEVNFLAARLAKLSNEQIIKLCAISESGMYFDTVGEYIEYTYASDMFTLNTEVFSKEDLPPNTVIETDSQFTSFGYIVRNPKYSARKSKRKIPERLNLKGSFLGEDLYAEPDYVPEGFEDIGVVHIDDE